MHTCSFCSNAVDQDHGVLGVDVGISHACSSRAAGQVALGLPKPERSSTTVASQARCSFCYMRSAATSALFESRGLHICVDCISLIQREILELPFEAAQLANGIYAFPHALPPNKSLERTREG